MTTITIGVNTSTISTLAFAELFQNATRDAGVTSGAIDIVINIGGGNVIIETGAFSQSTPGVNINSATINFSADPQNPTIPTLGSNFASGLPIRTLILPAQTTLEPNALQNLQALQHLDASLLTNPVPSNGLNLDRVGIAPLIISMPTSEVSFGSNAVVIPPTGAGGNTTTLVFNGFVPSTTQLSQMFSNPTNNAAIQVSLNYSSSSGTSNAQLTALSSSLNNNVVAVSFNQVQNVLQGLTQATSIASVGSLTSASVFAGEIFDSIVISPKADKPLLQLKQVVLTSLSSAAIKSNIQNIPIPSSIKTGDIERSVVGLVPKMNIPVTDLTSTAFYIMDNYIDPSDTLLPPVPLIAIFSKENAGSDASFGKFFPALRCNGTITVSNEGTVVVSGRRDQGLLSHCWGYKSVSGAGLPNRDSQNLLDNPDVGSVIPIYDRGTNLNALPIAHITYPTATTFEVHFKPIAPFDNQATSSTDLILGCMQGYMPTGNNAIMVVDFTNVKNDADAAWSAFKSSLANLIARNNALKAQIAAIRASPVTLPQGTTVSPIPADNDISPQLTALINSDFSLAFSNWKTLEFSYGAYNTYLDAVNAYVNAVIGATNGTSNAATQSTNAAFTAFKTALESAPESATGNLREVRAQLTPTPTVAGVAGVAPIFTSVIKNYINRRLSIGMQTFKSCTVLDAIPNFDSLRNISQINDETFYFCTAMSDAINIPVNVVSIGARAFQHCIGAASIDIQSAFALRTIGDSAFETCQKADGNLSFSCAIGQLNSVERIGNRAFYGCMKLTGNMYFPPGLKSLGVSAFEKCESLNGTIVFPDKPDSDFNAIPNNAFADCKNVTGISTNTGNTTGLSYIPGYRDEGKPIPNGLILPANIKKIGENAFSGCAKFAGALNLQQQGSVIESIGDRAFQGCSAFTSLSLPTTSTYTIVATECFRGCNKLTNLVIPANVIYILDGAFRGCTQISKVPLLDNIATIGNDAFNGCIVMSGALVLGENLVLLGDRAFSDCIMLTSATFMGPRPEGLGQATLIFGITAEAGASTTFYVNVFTENGWDVSQINNATPSGGGVIINKSFRKLVTPGNKSLVNMAYIDFNTHVPSLMSREITLNQFNAFTVYENTGGSPDTTNTLVTVPVAGHSWNDVILPSTLIGKNIDEAGLNFNPAPAIQSLVTSLISPKIDAVQTAAINASFGSNHLLNALDGRNFEVTTITLAANIASIPATGTGYGVFTDQSVTPNVDRLYLSSGTGTAAVLVTGSQNEALCFYVDTNVLALQPKYVHKIINVDATGAITISSNVTAIGYGPLNAPTTVLFTSDQPTTARNGQGYTIVQSIVPGVLDKMYVNTLPAPAGTYYVVSVTVGTVANSATAAKYNGMVIHVSEDGSVRVLESKLNNHFIDIPVANVYTTMVQLDVGLNAINSYGFLSGVQDSGANTNYRLYHKASAAEPVVAASYYYHVHSSNITALNNRLILVLPNGGVSTASFGNSGSVRRLETQITELAAEAMPIYSSNLKFQNFDYHVNGVVSLAETQLNTFNTELTARINAYNNAYTPLVAQIQPFFSAGAGARWDVTANFANAFNALKDSNTSLDDTYTTNLNSYETAVNVLRRLTFGDKHTVGLRQIQFNVLNNAPSGILHFRRESTFNTNALSTTTTDDTLSNELAFVTAQMDQFLKALLVYQHGNRGTNFATGTVPSVQNYYLFDKSPTTDPNALSNKSLKYINLSTQQKVLFDHVVNAVNLWFNSNIAAATGVAAGGNKSWNSLYAVTNADNIALSNDILTWGRNNIFGYFEQNGAPTIYNQFMTKNQPNTVATLENIRSSMEVYETRRLLNDSAAVADVVARVRYINAATATTRVTQSNVTFDASSTAALLSADGNGKLRFDNATLTSVTKLYISLNDSTSTPINLTENGYFDEIQLNNGLTFSVNSVIKTAERWELGVALVTGTSDNGTTVNSFSRYQTLNLQWTLGNPLSPVATLSTMNDYVYRQYHIQNPAYEMVTPSTPSIKDALRSASTAITNTRNALLSSLEQFNNGIHQVVTNSIALNQAENKFMANMRSSSAGSSTSVTATDVLNGAQMLARESELLKIALAATTTVSPTHAQIPSYAPEDGWFQTRVSNFWKNLTPNNSSGAQTAYTAAMVTFHTARENLQYAALESFIANTLASQTFITPVTTFKLAEQAQAFSQNVPLHLVAGTPTQSLNAFAELVAERVSLYVLGRDLITQSITTNNDADKITARNNYQNKKITEAASAMMTARDAYGRAAYNRYLAVIDLAIVSGYLGTPAGGALTNTFRTAMDQWNAASNNLKNGIFSNQIRSRLFDMVYSTDSLISEFPLTVETVKISWFGNTQNGFLNSIIDNGRNNANTLLDYNNFPLTKYQLLTVPRDLRQTFVYNNTTNVLTNVLQISTANSILVNGAERIIISSTDPTTSSTSEQLSTTVFNARVNASISSISSIPPNPAYSFNPFNIAFSNTSTDSVSSLRYTVVALGYASYASAVSASPSLATGFGFTEITNVLSWNESVQNGVTNYKFTRSGNVYYGIKQSSNVISSWARASPNQNVIIFYEGTVNAPPTRLSASADNVNALCDDAKFVALIDSNNHVSIYTYDVFGVTSGDLVAVGIIGSTQKLYSVVGALQKDSTNQNVNLAGSLTIPARLRTIGINAFSGSTQVQSLTFRSDQTNVNSVVIGSNAFQGCTLLPAINLGASIASIAPSAFLKCTGAASLALPPALQVANHWSFLGCNQIANNVVLPNTLVQIGVQSFANCTSMKCGQLNESLPDSVQRIGAGAFFRCLGLTGGLNFNTINDNGKFVSNLSVIGSAAFMGCSGLTGQLSLPINSNYRNVLPYTFASIDANLFMLDETIYANLNPTPVPMLLSGNVDFSVNKVTTVERNAFYRCVQLALVTLSNSITSVAQQAFMRCAGIQGNLAVPASVKIIGNEAFRACSGITGLNIVSTVVSQIATEAWLSLGSGCFQECTSIANSSTSSGLLIPNSVNSIGDSAFQGCTSLVNISVGSGLTRANSFGSSVFNGCTRLERVTFAFSYLSRDIAGQSVVKNATTVAPFNDSFTGCTALGVTALGDTLPAGTIQIQSGATGWTPGRAVFFNRLTIVINNRNITFYLKEFDQLAKINVVDPSKDPLQQEVVPTTDAQATVHIKASDMRKIFLVSTDSFVNTNAGNAEPSVGGQMFFVRPELLPRILNVANAQVVQGGIESYNAPVYEQLVKDDVMRYYAMSLFNSADWVTLFANDTEMIENMVASSGLMPLVPDGNTDENGRHLSNTGVLHNIMKELEKVGYENQTNMDLQSSANYPTNGTRWRGLPDTVLPENGNIGKKLFGMISRNDPNRINSMVLTGATPSELPFLPGDQFIFVFTLNENSVILNPSLPAVIVKKRTYLIRMILTDEFNSGNSTFLEHFNALYKPSALNQNIIPVGGAYAADYMYSNYNLYVAIKQNSQTSDSVYSRVTQNTYEPVPMPPQLLPFTGWFYNYKQNTQTIRLDFTPPDINNSTNQLRYNELKYLSAYVYFPDNWSSVTTLPSRNNFPQWVLTFSNGSNIYVFRYKASFLSKGAEVMNFLGQTGPFDFTNTHVQLLLAFEPTEAMLSTLKGTNGGTRPEDSGTINSASGTNIYRQRNIATEFNNGLRMANSKVGPFTYPPIARGYQCIPMPSKEVNGLQASQITLDGEVITSVSAAITAVNDNTFRLVSAYLEINMNNEDGFVPNIIVKSVEVVAQNYEAYYLAPLDPNSI
jgi:hypothetical protein